MFRSALRTGLLLLSLAVGWGVFAERAPDVSLPGAAGRLGVGGGWWAGSWATLRLEVSAPGAWRLVLATEEGALRSGVAPVRATLTVPDSPGVRVRELRLPLLSRRPATLTLAGPQASKRVTLNAFPGNPAVLVGESAGVVGDEGAIELGPDDLSPNPADWLAGPRLVVQSGSAWLPRPSTLLAWLAAGGSVSAGKNAVPGLEALQPGPVGLGYLGSGGGRRLNLERLFDLLAPAPTPPARRNLLLALWAGGAFALALGVYSARRSERVVALGSGAVCLLAGLVGFTALQPGSTSLTEGKRLLIGAAGWGIETTLTTRFSYQASAVRLPAAVKPTGLLAREYSVDATLVEQPAWSRLTYWTAPRAALLPLRSRGGRLINTGQARAEAVFVVGRGQEEPLAGGTSRGVPAELTDLPPRELAQLSEVLPVGTAVARVADATVVALPEEP